MSDFHSADRYLARLGANVRRMAWRLSRMERPGVVEEYDPDGSKAPKPHMARVRLTTPEGQGGLTGWCHIEEASGQGKSKATLTKGQTVLVKCPNGDIRQAYISFGGIHSNQHRPNSTETVEMRNELGEGHVQLTPERVQAHHGTGDVTLTKESVTVNHDGGGVTVKGGQVFLAG